MSFLAELEKVQHWKIAGRGRRASFCAWTIVSDRTGQHSQIASAAVRRRRGETIEAMVCRGLAELKRRLRDGMPEPKPEVAARRKLRDAWSPSHFAN